MVQCPTFSQFSRKLNHFDYSHYLPELKLSPRIIFKLILLSDRLEGLSEAILILALLFLPILLSVHSVIRKVFSVQHSYLYYFQTTLVIGSVVWFNIPTYTTFSLLCKGHKFGPKVVTFLIFN